MAHKFQAIFDAIVAAATGLPVTGNNVVTNRFYPHQQTPALAIYLGAESEPDFYSGIVNVTQAVRFEIAIKAKEEQHDNELLEIKKDIYNALMNLNIPDVINLVPIGTTEPQIDDAGEKPQSLTVYEWAVTYRHNESDISL